MRVIISHYARRSDRHFLGVDSAEYKQDPEEIKKILAHPGCMAEQ